MKYELGFLISGGKLGIKETIGVVDTLIDSEGWWG